MWADIGIFMTAHLYVIPQRALRTFHLFHRINIRLVQTKSCFTIVRGFVIYLTQSYLPNNFAIAVPKSAGESTTVIPQSLKIAFLAAAVSSAPPTIAPA